jgi:hypothetical protein
VKPATRRLLILDVIIAVVAVLQFSLPSYPKLFWPAILSDVVLIAYGIWLLARRWGAGHLD